jgi:uncharacterized protein (DUF2267 family)
MEQFIEKIKPKTYDLLHDLSRELEIVGNLSKVKIAFESVLHSFAACLDVDKGIEVMSNLPSHLKDIFLKGWKPFSAIEQRDFITAVQEKLAGSLTYSREQILSLVKKVFRVIAKYIAPDKMIHIHSCMNAELITIINNKS